MSENDALFSVGVSIRTLAVHVPSTLQMINSFGNGDFRITKRHLNTYCGVRQRVFCINNGE